MAAIPVTFNGVLADKFGRTLQSVILFGELSYSDRQVGGGPIQPPPGGGGPPSGGEPPHPEFPIAGYPDFPYPGQPIYRPGYPGGAPPPNLPGEQPPSGGGGNGGTPIPPEEMPPPAPPPEQYAQQLVVQVWHPDTQTWTTKAYAEYPSQWPAAGQSGGQQQQRR